MSEIYKIVFIGDCGVGKTSIIGRLINNSYNNTTPTLDTSNNIYQLNLEDSIYQLNLIDIPGQVSFLNIMPNYFRNCDFAIAVFDLGDRYSLGHLNDWIQIFKEYGNEFSDVLIVGNKSDVPEKIPENIIEEEIKKLGIDYDQRYTPISAKSGANLSIFLEYLGDLIENSVYKNHQKNEKIELDIKDGSNEKRCCKV